MGFSHDAARRDSSFDGHLILIGWVERGFEPLPNLEGGPVRVERVR
ncbi:hypothetical protein [Meiothermus luteus]|jgi:hypothetical protein|nr:hypothetical protein [Meiothermus luteus]